MNPLQRTPKRFRADPAYGIQAATDNRPVEREGGDYNAGLIRGAAIVTRGEALGHGLWLDRTFLEQTAEGINTRFDGAKVRFTHPGLSSDGLGTFLGRAKNAQDDGDVVRADIHFVRLAHETPDGNLATYVMDLAETDPSAFGASITYMPDCGAEEKHAREHKDEKGIFHSPDSGNANNLPHARLFELRTADVVDDPAANPDGLFRGQQGYAAEAEELFAYSLGLSNKTPELVSLEVDPDRVSQFVRRFLKRHNLTITSEYTEMPEDKQADKQDAESDAGKLTSERGEGKGDQTQAGAEAKEQSAQAECRKFIDTFGEQGGEWFADGLDFEAAKDKYIAALKAERDELAAKLKAVDRGEEKPAEFKVGNDEMEQGKAQQFADRYGESQGRVIGFYAEKIPAGNR